MGGNATGSCSGFMMSSTKQCCLSSVPRADWKDGLAAGANHGAVSAGGCTLQEKQQQVFTCSDAGEMFAPKTDHRLAWLGKEFWRTRNLEK